MEIICVFFIFGLVTLTLSFNFISQGKYSVYKIFVHKYNLKNKGGYYVNLDSNEQFRVRKHRVAGIGRLPCNGKDRCW